MNRDADARLSRDLVAVLALAALVRAACFAAFARSPLFDVHRGDQVYYRAWGLWIAGGDWLGSRAFEQGPLYAYLLGVFYRLVGPRDGLVVAAQLALGLLTVGLVHACATRLFGARSGLCSGVLAAIFAPFVFYECMLMKTFLEPLLVLAALACGIRLAASGRARWAAAAGAAIGALCLVREIHALLLLPLLAAAGAAGRGRFPGSRALAVPAALLAGCALALAPAVARNRVVAGDWVVSTSGGGEAAYLAFGPWATGYYAVPDFVEPVPFQEHQDFREEAFLRAGRPLSRGESSRFWFREAAREIAVAPGRAARLVAAKLAQLFNDHEAPDNENLAVTRELVAPLGLLATFGWIAGLGWIGAAVALRRGGSALLPAGFALALVAEVLLSYNFGRFRAGLAAVWLVLAGPGLAALAGGAFGKDAPARRGAGLAAAGAGLLTLLAFLPPVGISPHGVERLEAWYRADLAGAAAARERIALAGGTAAGGGPDDLQALGAALNAVGHLPEAIAAFEAVPHAASDPGAVPLLLADISRILGRLDAAEAYCRRFLAVHPGDPSGLELAARIAFQRAVEAGGRGASRAHLAEAGLLLGEALVADPARSTALSALARVEHARGDRAAAARLAREALRLDPDDRRARGVLRLQGAPGLGPGE